MRQIVAVVFAALALATLGSRLAAAAAATEPARAGYDPLALPAAPVPPPLELTVHDRDRDRAIPLRVFLPAAEGPAPVILFSHGLGGTRHGCTYLGAHWAGRGYAVVFLQHPGSDDGVWRQVPPGQRLAAMTKAANGANFMLRVRDVPAVLDELDACCRTAGHPLAGRLDLGCVGMSGHSFGAVTTQAVSGQVFGGSRALFTDDRIKAALAFSPSSPRRADAATAFAAVRIPWLLMTGTEDTAPIGAADVASRLAVYPHLPAGDKYELVLHRAEHSAFTEDRLPGDRIPRNPNHHRAILALSAAFGDAYLRSDAEAVAWLRGPRARSVLEPADRWQFK